MDWKPLVVCTCGVGFGLIVLTYPTYARQRFWPVGSWASKPANWQRSLAVFVMTGGLAGAFWESWWAPAAVLAAGFTGAFILTELLKEWVQGVAFLGCIVALLVGPALLFR